MTNVDGMNGLETDIGVQFSLAIGKNADALNRQAKAIAALASKVATPVNVRLPLTSLVVPANGFGIIGNNQTAGPTSGYFWDIRAINICGSDPSAVLSGTAYVFISGSYPSPAVSSIAGLMDAADWRDKASSLPAVAFYGAGQMRLRANEQLYIAVTGATSGQSIQAAITVDIYQDGATTEGFLGAQ